MPQLTPSSCAYGEPYVIFMKKKWNLDSLVGVVTRVQPGLSEVRFPPGERWYCPIHFVSSVSGSQPFFCSLDYFPRGKAPGT